MTKNYATEKNCLVPKTNGVRNFMKFEKYPQAEQGSTNHHDNISNQNLLQCDCYQ